MRGKFVNFVGKRFGRLLVLERVENKNNKVRYKCKCDCGNFIITSAECLRRGTSRSCGCYQKDYPPRWKHGNAQNQKRSKEYGIWCGIKNRCYNTNDRQYSIYGGRGIFVCDRWLDPINGFQNFLDDMGKRPKGKSLDRIDNNGPYSPENCRWATPLQQSRNRNNNHLEEYNGEIKSISEWCEIFNLAYGTIIARLNKLHWSFKKAIETPVGKYIRKK